MGARFSSKELLDKDTHPPEKTREGRVTTVPGLFLFRLQTSKTPGIPHPPNPALRMTLDQHSTYIYVLMWTAYQHWTTGFAPLLALTQVPHKPNHLQYSLHLILLLYYFSQAKTGTSKSNNQLQHMWNSFTDPPIKRRKNISHKDQKSHTAQSCCIRREALYCNSRRASPPSNPLDLPYRSIQQTGPGRDLLS